MTAPAVAVVGGSVAGLAAAERFVDVVDAEVTLFERQSYAEKRVNCGEAITESSVVPLRKTPANGFRTRIDAFDVSLYESTTHATDTPPLTRIAVEASEGYVTDRNVVERRWAGRLRERGVDVRERTNVTVGRYRELREEYDYVVDATGQPALSLKATGATDRYAGAAVALNADVVGTFPEPTRPSVAFEGYLGYFWVFPKSERRANVGIGWGSDARPDSYVEALWAACDRFEVPRPPREAVQAYTIPLGPSLAPAESHPATNVYLVGDAAGIANRYQGEGICQAIRSSYLLADLVVEGRESDYPECLYASMREEYRLAALIRAVFEETGDTQLLADVVDCLDGLSVEAMTRDTRTVFGRIARHPAVGARLLGSPGVRRRLRDAYADRWEWGTPAR